MTTKETESDSESDSTAPWARLRFRVERASVPTLGEFEGVRVVFETSGGRLLRLAVVVAVVVALAYLGLLPLPW